MALSTSLRLRLNRWLRLINLRLETLTAEKIEVRGLAELERRDYFALPAFPVPTVFECINEKELLEELRQHRSQFDRLADPTQNEVCYSFDNGWFNSPDAEVLYTIIRKFRPSNVIEVGSGNSTKIIRQAIIDGQLNTRLVSIDPQPRAEIGGLADKVYKDSVETLGDTGLFDSLDKGDVLFIDSSHVIRTGNDVVFLYLQVIPKLRKGVLIHIHDIFLPYDYPKRWVVEKRWGWNEQYLVQSMLMYTNTFEVLWAGYYLQRTRSDFQQHFPHMNGGLAQSLWIRKTV